MIIAVFMGMSIAKNKDVMRIIMRFWFTLCLKSSLLSIIVANMESGARILPNKVTFAIAIKKFEYLQTFIKGLINDKEAVIGQIENTITNGLVEGKVCKLKLKKRSTYGRNSFELLRCLILQE